MMDVINLLIKRSNYCFLCFKESCESVNLDENLEIHEQSSESKEIITHHACNHCTDILLKTYLTIKKGLEKLKLLDQLIHTIFNKINAENLNKEKLFINLKEGAINNAFKEVIKNELIDIDQTKQSIETGETRVNVKKTNQPIICHYCGKKCKSPKSLTNHIKTHSEVTCPYCQKTLKNNSHYKIHLKNHKAPVKRKLQIKACQFCSYTTVNNSNLQLHINKYHLHVKPYICDNCKKGFHCKSHLIEHFKTHKYDKNLICEVCGEHFSYKKTLKQHLTLHNGLRPYKCHICSHKFVTNSRRNEHIKRKHSEKSLSCSNCLKKYSLQKDLNRHCKIAHPN